MQGSHSEKKVRAMFQSCKPKGGKLGMSEFETMVGMLSETEKQTKEQVRVLLPFTPSLFYFFYSLRPATTPQQAQQAQKMSMTTVPPDPSSKSIAHPSP